jgi:hypothetical protein
VNNGLNVFVCRPDEESGFLEGQPYECVAQFEETAPGDFLFFYRDEESEDGDGGEEERLKGEISAAYEKVASTAHMEGSLRFVVRVADPVICYFLLSSDSCGSNLDGIIHLARLHLALFFACTILDKLPVLR